MAVRGQLEIQFNWIFILVAGAVILGFFFSIIVKQQNVSEQKLAISLVNELDAITTGASVAKGAAQRLDLPKAGIDFACSSECTCSFSIGKVSRDFKDKLLFAPKRIEGDDIVFWTLDWKIPFRATNFLFATNERIKYFFVTDDSQESQQLKAKVQALIPEQVNADFITLADVDCNTNPECVRNENYVQVKLVFLNIDPNFGGLQLHESFSDTTISAALITPDYVNFYKRKNLRSQEFDAARAYYVGDAGLFASIFAEDEQMFRCNLQEASRKLGYVSKVLADRMEVFRGDAELIAQGCPYNPGTLDAIRTLAVSQASALNADVLVLRDHASTLNIENEALLRQSCPTLY
ncbi:hypothetical protein HY492_04125 [Candidatus Woesearchaeota archaeon]|nr:hypothetical protein [Candidatus Woesearchaeota archaeon]